MPVEGRQNSSGAHAQQRFDGDGCRWPYLKGWNNLTSSWFFHGVCTLYILFVGQGQSKAHGPDGFVDFTKTNDSPRKFQSSSRANPVLSLWVLSVDTAVQTEATARHQRIPGVQRSSPQQKLNPPTPKNNAVARDCARKL